MGPFKLKKDESAFHSIKMPNYVGAVRVMVVARKDDTYGNSEKSVLVKQPIMVQSTIPRVLGPNESLTLPTNIWALDEKINSVNVRVKTTENIALEGEQSKNLSFDQKGDKQAYFKLNVGNHIGAANITTTATGNRGKCNRISRHRDQKS